MNSSPANTQLTRFFGEMIGRSFSQLGLRDREIAGYMAGVLAEFSRSDRLLALGRAEGTNLHSLAEMLVEELGPPGRDRILGERAIRKHVGDYTLFMSGLFRAFVERRGYLGFYMEEGRRSYEAVSQLDLSLYRPGYLLFHELSDQFTTYADVLDYMRKAFFVPYPGENPFAGFLRQIEGLVLRGMSHN